jgi:hypothetical protein
MGGDCSKCLEHPGLLLSLNELKKAHNDYMILAQQKHQLKQNANLANHDK